MKICHELSRSIKHRIIPDGYLSLSEAVGGRLLHFVRKYRIISYNKNYQVLKSQRLID